MQSEWVVIAIVSTVVATTIAVAVAAVGAFGSLLLGHLIPNVVVVTSLPAAAHELGLRSSE
jgi:hypothetical protein